MGFRDQFKGAMDSAQQMAKQAGSMIPNAGDMEYANLAQKVASSGLPGVATVKSITATGRVDPGGGKRYSLEVSVKLEGGEAYDTTMSQYFLDAAVPGYQPGARLQTKADPDDKTKVILYGPAPSGAPAATG